MSVQNRPYSIFNRVTGVRYPRPSNTRSGPSLSPSRTLPITKTSTPPIPHLVGPAKGLVLLPVLLLVLLAAVGGQPAGGALELGRRTALGAHHPALVDHGADDRKAIASLATTPSTPKSPGSFRARAVNAVQK